MKNQIKIIFILLSITTNLNGFSQNSINWISWDKMIQQRDSDSIKKKVFIDLCSVCRYYSNPYTWLDDDEIINKEDLNVDKD